MKSTVYFKNLHPKTRSNLDRYEITAWLYDILDCPWERQYRKWRPSLVGDLRGRVLEVGVGTGRNLKYYHADVELNAIDLSAAMLKRAKRRGRHAKCRVDFVLEDACSMASIPSESYDWVIATYLCCVIPDELQCSALEQFARVLKPGGRFQLLEMIYSKTPRIRKRQDFFAPFVEKVYGARFDRHTLEHLTQMEQLKVTGTRFLKHDVYLLIEGMKEDGKL